MIQKGKSIKKNKISFLGTIWSTSLVLVVLGIIAILFFEAKNLSNQLKESITMQVELAGDGDKSAYIGKMNELKKRPFVKKVEFVSKDEAAKIMQEEMGEKFIDILGYNPLFNAFNVNIKAEFATPEKLSEIKKELMGLDYIKDVTYSTSIASSLHNNLNKLTFGSIILVMILLVIVIMLIDNTIRLAMYSDRFLIKSMQLVGATRWYIIKPYITKSFINAWVSTLVASLLLMGMILLVSDNISGLSIINHFMQLLLIFLGLAIVSLIISVISTYIAVSKYLSIKLDDLY
ncbi:MAG: hypothetical protein IPK03_15195 [Bacteroidetes bacterium]|nr:hypothetical protein [Bacteroidota bacterium]